ncbi:uncharacterized protein tmc5 isoform X2 [Syngnathoides biaculeatus]|uniref:uncharacterized protein tmc5 isoform X2 n=1 Tax=Syngnathoides biaculeatus TaxID=300417 RepID=UPI002ADD69BE|nr:uncharacterized protein tmc5 isoform X2 [Syngnathoides biaculeatus]
MSNYKNGGLFNPAYHDNETLEIDRKQQHTNPYVQEEQDWWKDRQETYDTEIGQSSGNDAVVGVPWGGWQEEGWRGRESIPMKLQSRHPESSVFQHDFNHGPFQTDRDVPSDQIPPIRLPSASSGTVSMRWRGVGLRMNVLPSDDPHHLAFTEEAIRNQVENEEQTLVKELVGLSTRDRIKAIRDLPMSFEEKKHIRNEVLAFESRSQRFTCFADCSERASLFLRRCGYSIRSARQTLELWQGIMKESMANSFKTNYVLVDQISNSAWQLLCSWDFKIINERAVRQRKNNLRVQLKESMSEKAQRDLLTLTEKLKQIGIHLGSWLLSTSLAVGCAASIYFLCQYEQQNTADASNWSLGQEAETLLVPFVVSLMNLVVPLSYSLFSKFEQYSSQRSHIYALLLRNVILKMLILGVLCYYWMNVVAQKFTCWESMVGQALYRLVIFDFFFLMLGSLFGEFLSNFIGRTFLPHLGVPEFDVARNVLELIYAQTIVWIGIYFSPLLPAIQIVKFFILFFVKKVSLTHNCQPPRRTGRAAQMQTIFIALLFFPFFVGALSIVAYTAWRLTPSEHCGPFRGHNTTFSVIGVWIDDLQGIPGSQGAIWIYENVIKSEIVYFLGTLIILIIIYIFWQVSQGRKHLIGRLRQQIVNEGKDKSFLLEKLQNLQKCHPKKKHKHKNQKKHSNQCLDKSSTGGKFHSNTTIQASIVPQQLEQEERWFPSGMPLPSDISTSDDVVQTLKSSQRDQEYLEELYPMCQPSFTGGMPARHVGEHDGRDLFYSTAESPVIWAGEARQKQEDDSAQQIDDLPSSLSNAMIQVMQARQRVERDESLRWGFAPPQHLPPASSSALIQAMLVRQQAQNEYDDGY